MKRKTFLLSLGLSLPALSSVKQYLQPKPICIYNNYLRGIPYYELRNCADLLRKGSPLNLKREIENVYDNYAVAVFYQNFKLGYLPAYENIVVANMLDQGVELKAAVSHWEDNPRSIDALSISINANLISERMVDTDISPSDDQRDIYRG